ncbi:chemotaxis protein CheB [Flavobacterium silvaticum]|uniref:protein-glutamate methylesterase n=1 Tax=Flavobacterium silvaticum TaxID=1852020 RepID=A0A972JFJ0_9FLAO|nr:chemotaxis protein CheB [Flavobacterium silvaticum]NMH28019.1 chemotaxis protein CheB [Flavobacterium silvaticum]
MEKAALKLVVIGGSAGSVDVIMRIVPFLPSDPDFSIVLVLHRKSSDDTTLEDVVSIKSAMKVIPVEDKTMLETGAIFIAPSDYHLLFEPTGELSLDVSEKINYSRPSIDVSFESAAAIYKNRLTAILLTGANSDGTAGLISVKENDGFVIIQDPESADIPFMPANALENMTPDLVLDVDGIVNFLNSGF